MEYRLQNEVREFLVGVDVSRFCGVTLTMKQMVDGEFLTKIKSYQNLRHFMNLLNKQVFGKRHSKYGHKLEIFPVLENSDRDRLHYHLILEKPSERDLTRFTEQIETCWKKTRFGHREIKIDETIDIGWTKYITKFHSHRDSIDWENVHLNRRV